MQGTKGAQVSDYLMIALGSRYVVTVIFVWTCNPSFSMFQTGNL